MPTREWWCEKGSKVEGIRFVSQKVNVMNTSSFVAARTNLIPSNSLTSAEGRMASVGSESVSSLTEHPFLLVYLEKGQ